MTGKKRRSNCEEIHVYKQLVMLLCLVLLLYTPVAVDTSVNVYNSVWDIEKQRK